MTERSILIFGAGKIGRSFIGQLFGKAGYKVVFVDMDENLVKALNRRKQYAVIIKSPEEEIHVIIEHVSAIHALDKQNVIKALCESDIVAVSVGKSALHSVTSIIAEGLVEREKSEPGGKLDIILAENMRSADLYFRAQLKGQLPPGYPVDDLVGLVETSIGKMVPIMTAGDLAEDPLQVFAEPYNTLILDRKGFRGEIPEIPELALKENMKAWVDRKAFIHNLGHASAAYFGYLKYPGSIFMYQVLADREVYDFARKVMLESARVLLTSYPDEFTYEDLSDHIDDLLTRFQNHSLGDTVFRVGCDLRRKLGKEDRFMGVIRMAESQHLEYDTILEAMAMGFHFTAKDEQGRMLQEDVEFHQSCKEDMDQVIEDVCGLDHKHDLRLITQLKQYYGKH